MREIKVLLICLLMCVGTGVTTYYAVKRQNKKIAVADAVRLFDQFNMKKEMEASAKVKLDMLNKQADSVGSLLQAARAVHDEEAEKKFTYAYSYFRSSFDEEYTRSNREINEQVWKRLNPTVEEFGRKMQLHVIIGANGMGSVLYNDDYYDVTEELIKYVNARYEGKQ